MKRNSHRLIQVFITLIYILTIQNSLASEPAYHSQLSIQLPGADKHNAKLINKIEKQRIKRGLSYKPQTKHLADNGEALYTNRLFLESSPYLLQHAHNPVNWYPWGTEAFATATKLNRPVLLSIGYSTCHWCHVMESESFEDLEIARYINENFIAIKVDREERPDIDVTYMAALHALGQGGGWPLNVWLTPQKEPFYGGTYYPARDGDRGAAIGLLTLLKELNKVYQTKPDEILKVSQSLVKAIEKDFKTESSSTMPSIKVMQLAMDYYTEHFDSFYGGIGDAPKFPGTTPVQFLLRYYNRTADKKSLEIVTIALDKMAAGGIYDHVGGGFHRYSIDNEWLVPHFEKMLYDNALLTINYLEAYQLTKNPNYKRLVNEILAYVSRDMTSDQGAFYSATDADSMTAEGLYEEGHYFTWDEKELTNVLGLQRSKLIKKYYSVSDQGNFEGRNILNTPVDINQFQQNNNISKRKLSQIIKESKKLLYKFRNKRARPRRDEKIITAWNGLMISAYSKSGFILNNDDYIKQASKSAQFILDNLYTNNRLLRIFKDSKAKQNGFLNDYAFFIAGLIDLYESTSNIKWLNHAINLDKTLESDFEDKNGGFFMTSNDHEKIIARDKPDYDGALPGGNSVQILNLLRLGLFTGKKSYTQRASRSLKVFTRTLEKTPMELSKMLVALDFYYSEAKEIIIITPPGKKHESEVFINELRKNYLPNRILSVISEGNDLELQTKTIVIAEGKTTRNGRTTAYVCKLGSCELPTDSPHIFSQQLNNN
ncbi:MAG: thioredoxin domain-containing protein [Gammaproteobacteria bacterium]|nr:thioredoxin domain-containing protein [Gammaproteobacteria bacterium]